MAKLVHNLIIGFHIDYNSIKKLSVQITNYLSILVRHRPFDRNTAEAKVGFISRTGKVFFKYCLFLLKNKC